MAAKMLNLLTQGIESRHCVFQIKLASHSWASLKGVVTRSQQKLSEDIIREEILT